MPFHPGVPKGTWTYTPQARVTVLFCHPHPSPNHQWAHRVGLHPRLCPPAVCQDLFMQISTAGHQSEDAGTTLRPPRDTGGGGGAPVEFLSEVVQEP